MNKPFFSVIVTEYNAAGFMRKGLDSIINQSFQDYELIVVCDSCTDDTVKIAAEYIRPNTDDQVIVVHHHRPARSRNEGLDAARGEWVLFMDDDDWYLHEFAFEMIAQALKESTDVDILLFAFIWKGIGYKRNSPAKIWPAIWNKCWRREFIGDERFPDWPTIDDYGFSCKMHPKARMLYWDQPFIYYNWMRPGSDSDLFKKNEIDLSGMPPEARAVAESYMKALQDGRLDV